ncbi:hypothetical protein THRCLA_22962 [Thraustotheca clavata]|uniref:Crossover junction endonuclease MUS81-like HHH domain-containing protein n=1 Tax=Thraustotheca clavata TaxID=74557 RepID=A0A1V9YLB4_9STRA|nr:hypothetical protein THRCLA_22962 [Thraustotheca clavata]
MSKKIVTKEAANELLEKCKNEGIRVPTDHTNALIQAGIVLKTTSEKDEFNWDSALNAMTQEFGVLKIGKEHKTSDAKDEGKSELKPTKKKKPAKATNPENQELSEAFTELAGFEFKRGERFKGMANSRAAKSIRDTEEKIESGDVAMHLKGIGKGSAKKIDEFLKNGKIEKLEDYRVGNMH